MLVRLSFLSTSLLLTRSLLSCGWLQYSREDLLCTIFNFMIQKGAWYTMDVLWSFPHCHFSTMSVLPSSRPKHHCRVEPRSVFSFELYDAQRTMDDTFTMCHGYFLIVIFPLCLAFPSATPNSTVEKNHRLFLASNFMTHKGQWRTLFWCFVFVCSLSFFSTPFLPPAVVGVVGEFVAAVLFWVEYRIQKRKESYRQSHGVFTLEGTKA